MKHKTWFRLVLKAIGVLLVGMSLDAVMGIAIQLLFMALAAFEGTNMTSAFSSAGELRWINWRSLGSLLQMCLGVYFFFGGSWVIDRAARSNRLSCPECGYDISRTDGTICPECGAARPAE